MRPSILAKELGAYDVVNVGAAGTLVVRNPGPRAEFLSTLRQKLPAGTVIAFCDGRDLARLERDRPFQNERPHPDLVPFVSVLSKAGKSKASVPTVIPENGEWFVRILGSRSRLLFGVYRRHMKTIGHLGRIDGIFGAPVTTRSWNTILSVLRVLEASKTRTNSAGLR
ncbi:MAG TPA: hypothetical protein VKB79_15410 [Bryobacteraceae bacterium]|nr:hypothetical protein [Bryobacteraceae bacterium]